MAVNPKSDAPDAPFEATEYGLAGNLVNYDITQRLAPREDGTSDSPTDELVKHGPLDDEDRLFRRADEEPLDMDKTLNDGNSAFSDQPSNG